MESQDPVLNPPASLFNDLAPTGGDDQHAPGN
jgi:hypothetical protein